MLLEEYQKFKQNHYPTWKESPLAAIISKHPHSLSNSQGDKEHFRRNVRGVVSECCRTSCSYSELRAYCGSRGWEWYPHHIDPWSNLMISPLFSSGCYVPINPIPSSAMLRLHNSPQFPPFWANDACCISCFLASWPPTGHSCGINYSNYLLLISFKRT